MAAHQAVAADYLDLLRLTHHLTRSEAEVSEAYRHAAFNVVAHNRDDHLRQFAFRRRDGHWTRTPAYDLTFSDGPGGEHTLLVSGEGRQPTRRHLLDLAERAGLKVKIAARVLDGVHAAVERWPEFAEAAGVSEATAERVAKGLQLQLP